MMKFACDYEIIDAHVHPFLEDSQRKIRFDQKMTPDEFVSELRKVGISRACGSVIGRTGENTWEEIRILNDAALTLRDRYPDFLIPGVHIHGGFPEESAAELRRVHARGVRWIGELVPYILGTRNLDDPGIMAVLETARDLGMTVNLHWGQQEEVTKAAKAFPTLNIVLAHPGDGQDILNRLVFIAPLKNVHLDFSGTGLFRWGALSYAIRTIGADRVLFGSDFPICNPGMNLYGALCENVSQKDFELFFSGNFRRLTGL